MADFILLQVGSKLKFKIYQRNEKKEFIDFFHGRTSRE